MVLLAIGLALAWGRAVAQGKASDPSTDAPVEPTGQAKDVLQKTEGYRSWPKFPQYEKGPKASRGHGGDFVVAYQNDVAGRAVREGASAFPDGSVIVKENRVQPDAKPEFLTTMAKLNGAWFWVKSTPEGKVFRSKGKPVAGDVPACVGCHSEAPKDMVFSH